MPSCLALVESGVEWPHGTAGATFGKAASNLHLQPSRLKLACALRVCVCVCVHRMSCQWLDVVLLGVSTQLLTSHSALPLLLWLCPFVSWINACVMINNVERLTLDVCFGKTNKLTRQCATVLRPSATDPLIASCVRREKGSNFSHGLLFWAAALGNRFQDTSASCCVLSFFGLCVYVHPARPSCFRGLFQ